METGYPKRYNLQPYRDHYPIAVPIPSHLVGFYAYVKYC